MTQRSTLPHRTDRDRLDSLIDWYDRYKPEAGQVIDVALSPEETARMVSADFEKDDFGRAIIRRQFNYRGRIIRSLG